MNKTRAIGLLIALAGAPLFVVISEWLFGESPSISVQVALQFLYCGMAAFLLWFVLRVERLPLTSIGLRRPTWLTVVSGLGLLAVSSYVLAPLVAPLQKALGTEGMQAGIDEACAALKEKRENHRHEDESDQRRSEKDQPKKCATAQTGTVEQQGEAQCNGQLNENGAGRVDDRVAQSLPEERVPNEESEIVETDERAAPRSKRLGKREHE